MAEWHTAGIDRAKSVAVVSREGEFSTAPLSQYHQRAIALISVYPRWRMSALRASLAASEGTGKGRMFFCSRLIGFKNLLLSAATPAC
jgi:hypothetical protein